MRTRQTCGMILTKGAQRESSVQLRCRRQLSRGTSIGSAIPNPLVPHRPSAPCPVSYSGVRCQLSDTRDRRLDQRFSRSYWQLVSRDDLARSLLLRLMKVCRVFAEVRYNSDRFFKAAQRRW